MKYKKYIPFNQSLVISETVTMVMVAIATLVMALMTSVSVPLVWVYPLFVLFMLTSLLGLCDFVWFNFNKYHEIAENHHRFRDSFLSPSSLVHFSLYVLLITTAFKLVSV